MPGSGAPTCARGGVRPARSSRPPAQSGSGAGRRTGPGPGAPWSSPPTGPPRGRRSCPSNGRAGPGQSARFESRANPGRAPSGGPGGPTAISPATSRSSSRRAATSSGARSGGHPPRPGSPATSSWTRTVEPGRRRAMARPSSSRRTPCQQATSGARRATLLRWMAPRKCHSGGGWPPPEGHPDGRPWPPARRRSSPRARSARRPRPRGPPRTRTPWSRPPHGSTRDPARRLDPASRLGQPRPEALHPRPRRRSAHPVTRCRPPGFDQTTRACRPVSARARWEKYPPPHPVQTSMPARGRAPAATRAADTAAGRSSAG